MTELLLASTAFALLVICLRMAGMTYIIASATHLSTIRIAVLTTVPALPQIILIVLAFTRKYGARRTNTVGDADPQTAVCGCGSCRDTDNEILK